MQKVSIVGKEFHVQEIAEDGAVLSSNEYPANLTYLAAVLDACGEDEALRAQCQAVVDADDVSPPAPAPGPTVEELSELLVAQGKQIKKLLAAQKAGK